MGETDYPTKSTFYEYDPTTDSWTQKADFPAKPRGNNITNVEFNGIATVINGRPFVGGGSGSGTVWSDWYEYIPSRNVWEKRANSFGAKYYCSIGNTFYAINDRYVQSYDATTDTWTKYPGKEIYSPIGPNTARGLYQVPVVNGKAYLGLGSSKEWWRFTP
jgi:N-acetylneuraminic acid mutarotase